MKTDPFDDAIRRKLEGVNPPFQEKNWSQFQRFMGSQGFPPSLWQTPTRWLQPALMAAAVTGVVISTIWQYRTTQSLNEHVQTLTKTVARMEQVQLRLQQSVTAMAGVPHRVDTIYLTPTTPSGSLAIRGSSGRAAPADGYSPGFSRRRVTTDPLSERDKVTASSTAPIYAPNSQQRQQEYVGNKSVDEVTPSASQVVLNRTTTADRSAGRHQSATDGRTVERSQATDGQTVAESLTLAVNPAARNKASSVTDAGGVASIPPEADRVSTVRTGRSRPGTLPRSNQPADHPSTKSINPLPLSNDPTLYAPSLPNQASLQAVAASPAITASGPLASVQLLTPLALSAQTDALAESWQRHLRRVRYRSPYTTSMGAATAAAEPASPARHTTPLPVKFRLGVGGDVGTAQRGPGVYAEAIWANRWTISTGLNQFDWVGDEYSTEKQFTAKTKRDFRRDYPGSSSQVPIGPGRPDEVLNISRTAQSIVVPVQVGYRFAVAKQYVLTPSVGINLSINPRETVAYSYERPMFGGQVQQTTTVERPVGWYSSITAGIGAERQWGHFVAQLSPVALLPIREGTGCLNSLSAGLRGRLFYQF